MFTYLKETLNPGTIQFSKGDQYALDTLVLCPRIFVFYSFIYYFFAISLLVIIGLTN